MSMQSEYDILQERISELLQQHEARNSALGPIYRRAIEQDIMSLIDQGIANQNDIDQAIYDLENRLSTVTDNVAYQVLNRAQDLIKVQQYFWDRYGYQLNLRTEFGRLQAIQANAFDAFAGIPQDVGQAIRTMLRDNEIMGKGKLVINDEISRLAGVTASRARLISGTSEFLYVGQFNANKAADLGVDRFKYKPGFIIPTSRPFSKWAVDHGEFTREEIDAIDRHEWESVPGIPLDKTGRGWQGMIPGVPVLVQGGGYNTIHRFALVFSGVSQNRKVTQPYPAEQTKKIVPDANASNVQPKQTEKMVASVDLSGVNISGAPREAYEAIFQGIPEDQVLLIERVPKPKSITKKGSQGHYLPNAITASPEARGGSTVLHEYGHHVDYKLNSSSLSFWSDSDVAFMDAFATDRAALNLKSSKTKYDAMNSLYDRLYSVTTKEVTMNSGSVYATMKREDLSSASAGISDIIDAMTGGVFRSHRAGGWGHGVAYYKRPGSKYHETFANLFELRAKQTNWDMVKELFPGLVNRFEEIISLGGI